MLLVAKPAYTRDCSIVLARREHCPRDPRQFVCCCHDQYVSWRPGLKRGHPGAHRDPVSLGSQYDRACSMNQDLAQVRVNIVDACGTSWRSGTHRAAFRGSSRHAHSASVCPAGCAPSRARHRAKADLLPSVAECPRRASVR